MVVVCRTMKNQRPGQRCSDRAFLYGVVADLAAHRAASAHNYARRFLGDRAAKHGRLWLRSGLILLTQPLAHPCWLIQRLPPTRSGLPVGLRRCVPCNKPQQGFAIFVRCIVKSLWRPRHPTPAVGVNKQRQHFTAVIAPMPTQHAITIQRHHPAAIAALLHCPYWCGGRLPPLQRVIALICAQPHIAAPHHTLLTVAGLRRASNHLACVQLCLSPVRRRFCALVRVEQGPWQRAGK